MAQQQLNFEQLLQIAVAEGATTPNPGATGVIVYSTTLSKPVWWNGTSWSSTFGTGGGGGGAVTALARVTANVAYSTPASTAAGLEANTGKADAFVTTVNANEMCHVDAILDFATAAATTGIAIGVNCTTNATGTANVKLNASIVAPVTNVAAATSVERIRGVASTTLNATVGTAILNTASVSPQGIALQATLVNLGSAAVTFRIVFGTEVNNSAVTLQANSVIKHTKQAV